MISRDVRVDRSSLHRFLAAGLLSLGLVACDSSEPPGEPLDLLLITLDTARADRFAHAGGAAGITPRIDALAEEGVGFSNAISPVPLTLPAHATLMTGRQPPSHTVRDNGTYRLPASETTLAELLEQAGYTTGAFVGATVLDRRYGLDQGFSTYDAEIRDSRDLPILDYPERSAEAVAAAAERWLEAREGGPLFAWVHLYDPHTPYRPPEPELSTHESAYDGEVAYADRVVGRLVDRWEERRGKERTLVVVTSDHGEGLGEHGEPNHGILLHDATLRVPLVIRHPGLRLDRSVSAPVHLADILPTVLGLLDLDAPEGVQGRDLGPLLRGGVLGWSPASGYAESLYAQQHHGFAPLLALRQGGWKIVRGVSDELFDLTTDPEELQNLADSRPQRTVALASGLESLLADLGVGEAEPLALDEKTRQALASLGYVWSSVPVGGEAVRRDPREALATMHRMAQADRRLLRGDVEGAVAEYRAVIDAEPQGLDGPVRLAQILIDQERGREAAEVLAQAVARTPQHLFLYYKLGQTLRGLGSVRESLNVFDAGLARDPAARELRDGRWSCLELLGRREELLAEAQLAVAADPGDGMARYARALACCEAQGTRAYREALERELAELPGDPVIREALDRLADTGAR